MTFNDVVKTIYAVKSWTREIIYPDNPISLGLESKFKGATSGIRVTLEREEIIGTMSCFTKNGRGSVLNERNHRYLEGHKTIISIDGQVYEERREATEVRVDIIRSSLPVTFVGDVFDPVSLCGYGHVSESDYLITEEFPKTNLESIVIGPAEKLYIALSNMARNNSVIKSNFKLPKK